MKRGIRIGLVGGLGNQLFQYYAGAILAKNLTTELVVDYGKIGKTGTKHIGDISELVLPFNYSSIYKEHNKLSDLKWRLHQKISRENKTFSDLSTKFMKIYQSPQIGFDENLQRLGEPLEIRGYFQTYRYFENFHEGHGYFPVLKESNPWFEAKKNTIDFQNSVAIHIRRGDYKNLKSTFGLLSSKYYELALSKFDREFLNKPIYVFCDELESAKEILSKMNVPYEVLNQPRETSPIYSLAFMSMFSNLVIANSSFSWWGAALGSPNKKIIAPEKWFRNMDDPKCLIPSKWNKIESFWE